MNFIEKLGELGTASISPKVEKALQELNKAIAASNVLWERKDYEAAVMALQDLREAAFFLANRVSGEAFDRCRERVKEATK